MGIFAMRVVIVELVSSSVVAVVPVVLQGANYIPDDKEYFDEAWRAVVEDGVVKASERQKHRFELHSPTGV
jgi:hypothetical protein